MSMGHGRHKMLLKGTFCSCYRLSYS